MATLNEIIAKAEALRKESYVNSIDPERVGSIMSDTLKYLNEFQLQSGSMGLDKIYDSVAEMNADNAPVSDRNGKPLKAGQLVVVVTADASMDDNGKIYRFDNPGWTYISKIANLNIDGTFAGVATPSTNPGTPTSKVFYFALEAGTYSNFGGAVLEEGLNILSWNGSSWAAIDLATGLANAQNEERTDLLMALLGYNGFALPTFQKNNSRVQTLIFPKAFASYLGEVTVQSGYEIILGVSDNPEMSGEVFLNDWGSSIDLSKVNKSYFRMVVRKTDLSELKPSDVTISVTAKVLPISEQKSLVETVQKNEDEIAKIKAMVSYVDYSNYEITNEYLYDNGRHTNYSATSDCTGFVPVSENDIIVFSGMPGADSGVVAVAGYSDNSSLSSGISLLNATGSVMSNVVLVIPHGVNYIKACSRNRKHKTTPSLLILIKVQGVLGANDNEIGACIKSPCFVYSDSPTILLSGASFATANGTDSGWDAEINGYNRWFETACKELNIRGINHAIGGQSIINTARMMLDANLSQPHGSLFMDNGKDVFDDIDVFVIMHVHNQNVLYTGDKTLADYKEGGITTYAEAYDYVIKQYMEWCIDTKNTEASKYYGLQYGKPCQLLLCTHWHDARTVFNNSVRKLCVKAGIPLCEFDRKIGFSKNYPEPNGNQVSIYHCWDSNAEVGTGAKEEIDGRIYGWHMQKPTYTSIDEYKLPYIQRKMANIFKETIRIGLND